MTVITTTLYYKAIHHKEDDTYCYNYCRGRALSKKEYDNITVDELRGASNKLMLLGCEFIDTDKGIIFGPTPETDRAFNAMSVEDLKEVIRKHHAVLMRSNEPSHRYVYSMFTKGPRKGETNWNKRPKVYRDQWYCADFLHARYGVVAKEGVIDLHEDGTFTVVEKAPA